MFNKEKEKSVTTYIRHNQMISQKKKIHKAHHKSNILKKKIIIDGFSGNS